MTTYPAYFAIEPFGEWPGELTKGRVASPFKSRLDQTMRDLKAEIKHLGGTDVVLAVAVEWEDITRKGTLYAGREPRHPGVILKFTTPAGQQTHANDKFITWQANLRGILLRLEALRGMARWVSSHGEEYRGFLAIESGISMGAGRVSTMTVPEAFAVIEEIVTEFDQSDPYDTARAVRRAKARSHPDYPSGSAELFQRVTDAETILRHDGRIR